MRKKLIEVSLPLDAINAEAAREKSIRHGHPSTLHLWWARRPLAACRAVLFTSLVDDPDEPEAPEEYLQALDELKGGGSRRDKLFRFIEKLVKWENSNDEKILGTARKLIGLSAGERPPAPPDNDDLGDMLHFAYEYDAYSQYGGLGELAEATRPILEEHERTGRWQGSLDDLRTCLFYMQRMHHNAEQPPSSVSDEFREQMWSLYHAIRERWDEIEPKLPPVIDPFCGGGSIPLEAQRLGLEAYGSDLNPVAVLITKAMIEFPPKFADMPPVNPEAQRKSGVSTWRAAQGLAEDVRYYGQWMRDEAEKRIGHLYPKGPNGETVIAWLWARTVKCPNPACGAEMPLVRSFALSTKKGKEKHVEPVVDEDTKQVRFVVKAGPVSGKKGTVARRAVTCMVCGQEAPLDHVRTEAQVGRMSAKMMAVVTQGNRTRNYVPPDDAQAEIALSAEPAWKPDERVPTPNHDVDRLPMYGMYTWGDAFTDRQLVALTTFSDLVGEAREKALQDATAAGMSADGVGIEDGGTGAQAYADAVATYLAFVVDKAADYWSSICTWHSSGEKMRNTFGRQAIPMAWDYTEANPFSSSTGCWENCLNWVWKVIAQAPALGQSHADQLDAAAALPCDGPVVVSTDPPYYDNIGYADLSDFFYVWLRRSLRTVHPTLFSTMLVPKAPELVATPHRFEGGRDEAREFFEDGLRQVFDNLHEAQANDQVMTVYYAFKQEERDEDDGSAASTGWETMLTSLLGNGFAITGTWPMRTELSNRMVASGTNALASSIVLVCRRRPENAPMATRREFTTALNEELPAALAELQKGNIAPVDLAQSSIGPGMAIFSRYSKVLEADGSEVSVRTALQLINQEMDAYLAQQEGELDRDTRFCVDWFTQYGLEAAEFGQADVLARAKNTSVAGLVSAGVLESRRGKVRLLGKGELAEDWDPAADERMTVWEATHHLIRTLDTGGEDEAARLVARLGGGISEQARALAYRLYSICDRAGWSELALDYNNLVISWVAIQDRAASVGVGEEARLLDVE